MTAAAAVRALLHTAAFACLAWLWPRTAHRLHESKNADASSRTLAPAFHTGHPQTAQHPQGVQLHP